MQQHAKQIMIVEDDDASLIYLQTLLQDLGYDVCATTTSATEALQQAKSSCPDLVLMDINLKSNTDGIAAAEQLRAAKCTAPIIFTTAYAEKEILARAKQTEPAAYLVKPIKATTLQAIIS